MGDPTLISGLQQYLNMDTGVLLSGNPASDGGKVDTIEDQHTTANDAAQTSSSLQGTWTENDADFNDHGSVTMDNGPWYECDSMASAFSGTDKPFTIIQVIKLINVSVIKCPFSFGGAGVNPFVALHHDGSQRMQGQRRDDSGSSVTANEAGASATTTPMVLTWKSDGTDLTIYIDGTAVLSGGGFDVGATTITLATIGAQRYNGGATIPIVSRMKLARQEVYNVALSDTDRSNQEDDLYNTYIAPLSSSSASSSSRSSSSSKSSSSLSSQSSASSSSSTAIKDHPRSKSIVSVGAASATIEQPT